MDRCFLAGILHEYDAEISRQSGDMARARESAERALYLYSVLKADPGVPSDYEVQQKIRTIDEIPRRTLRRVQLSSPRASLIEAFDRRERYFAETALLLLPPTLLRTVTFCGFVDQLN
jgi:hypothetical protein